MFQPAQGIAVLGLKIVSRWYMVGCAAAVQIGDTMYVSPELFDLMRHTEGTELEKLLRSVSVLHFPECNWMKGPDPCSFPDAQS